MVAANVPCHELQIRKPNGNHSEIAIPEIEINTHLPVFGRISLYIICITIFHLVGGGQSAIKGNFDILFGARTAATRTPNTSMTSARERESDKEYYYRGTK